MGNIVFSFLLVCFTHIMQEMNLVQFVSTEYFNCFEICFLEKNKLLGAAQ